MIFKKRSIRRDFLIQLIVASTILILSFSLMLYFFIKQSIYEEKYHELIEYAKNIVNNKALHNKISDDTVFGLSVEVVQLAKPQTEPIKYEIVEENKTYLVLMYPFKVDKLSYLKLTKEISKTTAILDKILNYIFITSIIGFILVIIYAMHFQKCLFIQLKSNSISSQI